MANPSIDHLKMTFPKTYNYDIELIKARSIGGSVLLSLESLVRNLSFNPGMKVLDLGCGKALSSVFLAKEYGLTVWAVDNFFSPSENFNFVRSLLLEDKVFPLSLDARKLPFPENFFDCIIIVNSYTYFGTDDKFLPYISRFLKPGGSIAVSDICFQKEINTVEEIPDFLKADFYDYWYHIHSLNWWSNKWAKTGLIEITTAAEVADIQRHLIKEAYVNFFKDKPDEAFAKALKIDDEKMVTFFNLVGKRTLKKSFLEEHFN